MSLDFILDNLNYEVVFEDGNKIIGNIEYVTHHLSDGIAVSNNISSSQIPEIAEFIKAYKNYTTTTKQISIVEYYEVYKKENNI